jgi:hypothetical protein
MDLKRILSYLKESGGKVVFYDNETDDLFEIAKVDQVGNSLDDDKLINQVNHDIAMVQGDEIGAINLDETPYENEEKEEEQFYIEPVE